MITMEELLGEEMTTQNENEEKMDGLNGIDDEEMMEVDEEEWKKIIAGIDAEIEKLAVMEAEEKEKKEKKSLLEKSETEMSREDYVKQALLFYEMHDYQEVNRICSAGQKIFPNNPDLYVLPMRIACELGQMDVAKMNYEKLIFIPHIYWDGDTFMGVLDYFMIDPVSNEKLCRMYLEEFQRRLPNDERCYLMESRLEKQLGNVEQSVEILKKTIHNHNNAPMSAMVLLSNQMERGEYEEALQTCKYYQFASCSGTDSTNIKEAMYYNVLAQDALLHKKNYQHGYVSEDEVEHIKDLYDKLEGIVEMRIRHGGVIQNRKLMLEFLNVEEDALDA